MKLKMLAFRAVAVSALLLGCGQLVNMSGGDVEGVERRVYVNDVAPNESLSSVIRGAGVYFVMQPGAAYQLRLRTSAPGQQLQVLRARGDYYHPWKTYTSTAEGDSVQVFTLQPDNGDSTRYYRAFLQSLGGGEAVSPQTVRLAPSPKKLATSLRVKVVLVRQLNGLVEAERPAFAQAIVNELVSVYTGFGITVTGSYEIVEPTAARFVANFGTQNNFPGTREAGTAYLYVVDNVILNGSENPDVLGFAPREGFDLNSDFVVLNVRGQAPSGTPAQRAAPLGVTAAHELGHLFGLRHTSASKQDRDADFDKSNTHDGFAPLSQRCVGLAKASASRLDAEIIAPDGRQYCLRTNATAECSCPDAGNLMFAYKCGENQDALASGQQNFLRWNLSLFQ